MKEIKYQMFTAILICGAMNTTAQTIKEELRADARRAAGIDYALTLEESPHDTPPPAGKKPFYIHHYGTPSPYYLDRPEFYDDPYQTLSHADSLGKLSELGRQVLCKVALLRDDAQGRTNELTEVGKQQARKFARQLKQRFPEIFTNKLYVDGRAIVQNNCLLTLGETALQLSLAHQPLKMSINASNRFQSWMDPQDDKLSNQRRDSLTLAIYEDFTSRLAPHNTELMEKLFNDADYASKIDATALSRQLFDLAGCSQYVKIANQSTLATGNSLNSLYDLFTPEDLHRHWIRRNAWAYLSYGCCTLNGGHQSYSQRRPLWNLIHMGDSVLTLDYPVIQLRYTRENVVMSLACLLELDNYGLETGNLDSLEAYGWADYRISPLGGSIMMVYYRTDKNDPDPLVCVLLNGREARLPFESDCAPFYHWKDIKRYYLRKLYIYARERNNE